jgi:iron complex outermembrane receptor protein
LEDYESAAGDDFSGNELPQAPGYNVVGMALYDIPLQSGAIVTLQLDFSYQDDIFFNNDNNPILSQEAYGLINARAAFTTANEQLEIALWGKNLNDEEFLVNAFDLSDFGLYELMRGSERSYGVEVLYRF